MLRRLSWPIVVLIVLVIIAPAAGVGFTKWHAAVERGGQQPADPFRIAGNLYYVGASDVATFLLTSPQGHVLLDAGYPGSTDLIKASITQLGFKITDIKAILSSEPMHDHAGGMADLKNASGAQVWASDSSAETLEAGGEADPEGPTMYKVITWVGMQRFPPVKVDHRIKDGDTIRVGPIAITAHITPGRTQGCTSWTFPVHDGDRVFRVVDLCDLTPQPGMRLADPQFYPGIRGDFERTFQIARSLPVDIWVTSHARTFGRYRKFVRRDSTPDPVAPFIDRAGYLAYIDSSEARFRRLLAEQQAKR
jgi:metallo-beta-lactamase class B